MLAAAAVVFLDQVTKIVLENALPLGSRVIITPVFDLVHVRNTGAAFSFLASASGWQRELFIGIGLAASAWIVWMLWRAERGQLAFRAALSLILGGALGNVIDRVRLGGVIDFLHFHWGTYYWPAFNVADSAITCGAVLLIIDALRPGTKRRESAGEAQGAGKRRPGQRST
jgi:signal peptidase II